MKLYEALENEIADKKRALEYADVALVAYKRLLFRLGDIQGEMLVDIAVREVKQALEKEAG